MPDHHSPSLDSKTVLVFFGLAGLIYGPSLGIGYLSDDFLYLTWLDQGFGELVSKLTVDSNPRMIRPLSALGWTLTALPFGAWLQHALSLALHGICALLVVLLVSQTGGRDDSAAVEARLCGLLFLVCPLLTEPVLWLSSAPDLWATALALTALWMVSDPTQAGTGRLVGSGICFAAALQAKESVVVAPLIALCWWLAARPYAKQRAAIHRGFSILTAIAGLYLVGRFLLFGGLGGYIDSGGQSIARRFDAFTYLRNLFVQLPVRFVIPLKRADLWTLPIALASFGFVITAVWRGRLWRLLAQRGSARQVFFAAAAFGIATSPVAPVFSVGVDHGGGRLIYFPMAVGLVGLGRILALGSAAHRQRTRVPLAALIALWIPIVVANTGSWREAGREVRDTVEQLRTLAGHWPQGSTVWVDGNDTFHDAYVWRNGFDYALRRAGLEPYRPWRLGTAAESPASFIDGSLGQSVFQIARDAEGRWIDRTRCYQALAADQKPPIRRVDLSGAPSGAPSGAAATHRIRLDLKETVEAVAIKLFADGPAGGFLWWLHDGVPRFNVTERRAFRVTADHPTSLRLPVPERPIDRLELIVELDAESAGSMERLELRESPWLCRY